MAASSNAGDGDSSTKPFVCVDQVSVNIGTFNLGRDQGKITSKAFRKTTLPNFRRIVAKGVEEGDLHLLNLCEVGGHMQGLAACNYDSAIIVEGALVEDQYDSNATQAYLSIWDKKGSLHPEGVSLQSLHEPEVIELLCTQPLEPQLVVTEYAVTKHACQGEGILINGQRHIRQPQGTRTPSHDRMVRIRKRWVRQALRILENTRNSCVFQPTVAILCGDVNLNQDSADACCQVKKELPSSQGQ